MPRESKKQSAPAGRRARSAAATPAGPQLRSAPAGAAGGADETRRRERVLAILAATYPEATTALEHRSPLHLLVATILSAQCTDERVNQVTPALFARFPTAAALAAAPLEELEGLIHSTGFFRAKARSIQGASHLLAERHGGEVPPRMEDLLELPGVARKTANVVLGTAFGLATGVVVDTHVKRVSRRLGLTREEDPVKIEQDLMRLVPREQWIAFSHQVILFGRETCAARRPACDRCPLAPHCPSAGRPDA